MPSAEQVKAEIAAMEASGGSATAYYGSGFEQETPGYDPIGAARDKAAEALGGMMADVSKTRPSVGRRVRVVGGRKYRGREGQVFWHGQGFDPSAGRYGNVFSDALRQAAGRYGYRVGVRCDDGSKFFVDANQVIIVEGQEVPA